MKNERTLGDSQKYALEIGKYFDKICKKYHLKYSLFGESLWGAAKNKGFLPASSTMHFMMLYEDYETFLKVCPKETEGTSYYLVNGEETAEIDESVAILAKRSKVTLHQNRKKDEFYYDFNIMIVPVFNSGNTEKEYKQHVKDCKAQLNIIASRKALKGCYTKRNIKYAVGDFMLTKKGQTDKTLARKKLKAVCRKYNETSAFVLLPWDEWLHTESIIKSATYNTFTQIAFEGHSFMVIKDYEVWLEDYYGESYKNAKSTVGEVNKMAVMGPEMARRLQLVELEMLTEIDRICRKYGIKYSLFAGTLLGAIRHKGFIPWDDDVDVCMLQEDYERFLEVAKYELDPEKYFIRTQESDVDCNLVFTQLKRNDTLYYRQSRNNYNTHLGVFVDIFPLYNSGDNWLLHKFQHRMCRFTKTMLWAHMGAATEKRFGYKQYYGLMAKVSNKTSYKWYLKYAAMFKNNKSKRVCYLAGIRNPFNNPFTERATYEDLVELDFEGHKFYGPRKWKECLTYCYSEDYMLLPKLNKRIAQHTAAHMDLGDLYAFEENTNEED